MIDTKTLRRKARLKYQRFKHTPDEFFEVHLLSSLLTSQKYLERIGRRFDAELSAQIAVPQFLIDSLGGRSLTIKGGSADPFPACHQPSGGESEDQDRAVLQ
jgi:hypothetical protein